jgi:hypothetical protein
MILFLLNKNTKKIFLKFKERNNMQHITANLEKLPRIFSSEVIASRVETGALQINDDWPLTVIRGDHSAWYAMQIGIILDFLKTDNLNYQQKLDVNYAVNSLEILKDLLLECIAK